MNDYIREIFSYFGLFKKMIQVKKDFIPETIFFGQDKNQYFLYYEPEKILSDKIIFWVHGGGWNSGSPKFFDYVGQCAAKNGYRFISAGYRLSKKYKYPCQIEDVCVCYKKVLEVLKEKKISAPKIVVAGPSAGAHLSSILCFSRTDQEKYGVDISNIIGFAGFGGPYSFRENQSKTLTVLLNQLFAKDYDRKKGESVSLMSKNHIPGLLIQSEHDGVIDFECALDFKNRAGQIGNKVELYPVVDKKNTHSWYTAGLFLETRESNRALDKFFSWIESL